MNKRQKNKKEMLDTVLDYLESSSSVWSVIPIALELKATFAAQLSEINKLGREKRDSQVPLGGNKLELKLSIAEKADILNDQVETFAILNDDMALEAKMKDSKTALFRLKNIDFVVRVDEIITAANAHKENLMVRYGLDEAQIVELDAMLDTFRGMGNFIASNKINRTVANRGLADLFEDIWDTTQRLDKVLKIFKNRDSAFYTGYQSSRVIIDK